MYEVGDKVKKTQARPGGTMSQLGEGVVAKVSTRVIVLDDGSKWRAVDGFRYGSQPTRGCGRHFEARIDVVPAP